MNLNTMEATGVELADVQDAAAVTHTNGESLEALRRKVLRSKRINELAALTTDLVNRWAPKSIVKAHLRELRGAIQDVIPADQLAHVGPLNGRIDNALARGTKYVDGHQSWQTPVEELTG